MRCLIHIFQIAIAVLFSVPVHGIQHVIAWPVTEAPSEAGKLGMTISIHDITSFIGSIEDIIAHPPDPDHTHPFWWRRRKHWQKPQDGKCIGFLCFFESAMYHEWAFFAVIFIIFLGVFFWNFNRNYDCSLVSSAFKVLFWMSLAVVFNLQIFLRKGSVTAVEWTTGYILELVFSLENIFIFSAIIKMFAMPDHLVPKTLFFTICWQNIIQMLLFMGLAGWLQSLYVLPYILGFWLILVGLRTASHDDSEHTGKTEEHGLVVWVKYIFGSRLSTDYTPNYHFFAIENYQLRISLLGPILCCLFAVDLLMELDVSLTKIQEFDNHFISYTSSALASFAMPDGYFLVHELFLQFPLLRYGISFILLYFGTELIFHNIVTVPDVANIVFMQVVIALCIICTFFLPNKDPKLGRETS